MSHTVQHGVVRRSHGGTTAITTASIAPIGTAVAGTVAIGTVVAGTAIAGTAAVSTTVLDTEDHGRSTLWIIVLEHVTADLPLLTYICM